MGILQKTGAVWQKVGIVQRALLVAVVMACVITAVLLTKWASTPSMELLYGNLSLEEVDQIVNKLREQKIPYELRGSSNVYVPEEKVLELRASLAGEGLPTGDNSGFDKLFDKKKDFGTSPFVQTMNYNRAMQDELAKTIQMIDGVASARVHIVRPEDSIFTSEARQATASVTLRLKPGWKVSPQTIAAITNLVANATQNLKPENVTIVDTQGNLLSSGMASNTIAHGANTSFDIKERVESGIEQDILKLLEPALGPGRASVEVAATLDMTSETIQTTKYEKGEPIEETINTTSIIKAGSTGSGGSGGGSPSPDSTDKQETIENKYVVPETVTTRSTVPGKVVSLSVAVLVDLTPPPAPAAQDAQGASTPPAAPTKIMTVADVEELVRAAVDPKLLVDNNALTVKDMPFFRPTVTVEDGPFTYEKLSRYIEIARQSSMGILAVSALLALKIFASAGRKTAAAAPQMGQLEASSLLPAGHGGMAGQLPFRQQITAALNQNPEQVRQLFASWLAEEK
jgi:flagellar M-ring protein FliF